MKHAKTVVLILTVLAWGWASADEAAYDVATIEPYLSAKQLVFFAIRLDGGVGAGSLKAALNTVGASLDDAAIDRLRSEDRLRYPSHRVLVLRSLRGTLPTTIAISPASADAFTMPLGVPVLVFADREGDQITFETCDVETLERFPESRSR